jgi:hypothetical protein
MFCFDVVTRTKFDAVSSVVSLKVLLFNISSLASLPVELPAMLKKLVSPFEGVPFNFNPGILIVPVFSPSSIALLENEISVFFFPEFMYLK